MRGIVRTENHVFLRPKQMLSLNCTVSNGLRAWLTGRAKKPGC